MGYRLPAPFQEHEILHTAGGRAHTEWDTGSYEGCVSARHTALYVSSTTRMAPSPPPPGTAAAEALKHPRLRISLQWNMTPRD